MSDVSRLLDAAQAGDRRAAADLLPLVYDELRQLAAVRLAGESPGQTLGPTALVHEVFLRLVDPADGAAWENRGHFFAAAAEAMRRILVDAARRKRTAKHGGSRRRVEVLDAAAAPDPAADDMLALDQALTRFAAEDSVAARVVELGYFAGLTVEAAAEALGLSRATAYRHWTYARAWLREALTPE